MVTNTILSRIRLTFIAAMALVLSTIIVVGVVLRNEQLALLDSSTRYLSAAGYRLQYELTRSEAHAVEAGPARSVPILLYHGIGGEADRFTTTERTLRDQLFALKRAGYETVSLAELEAFLRGEEELPERSFVLTFDDGRRDSYARADPLLFALGYKAVMFVATEPALAPPKEHKRYYLSRADLERMIASGRWELASHAHQGTGGIVALDADGSQTGNFLSNRIWRMEDGRLETNEEYEARLERELSLPKAYLGELAGKEIRAFSYPFGDYGQQTVNHPEAQEAIAQGIERHYALAFKQVWPKDTVFSENYPGDLFLQLRRIETPTSWSGQELIAFLEDADAKDLPYEDELDEDRGWRKSWGSVRVEDGALLLSSGETNTSASGFLDGTGHWRDYRLSVAASRGDTFFSLLARYEDGEHMLFCSFSDTQTTLAQVVDDIRTDLAHGPGTPRDGVFSVTVSGAQASCEADGVLVSASVPTELARGGIGMRFWRESVGGAVRIESLTVEPL